MLSTHIVNVRLRIVRCYVFIRNASLSHRGVDIKTKVVICINLSPLNFDITEEYHKYWQKKCQTDDEKAKIRIVTNVMHRTIDESHV